MIINILGRPGPKSIAGKKKSSMNAVKSGAFAKNKILPHESEQEYNRVRRELVRSFQPTSAAEKLLIEQMVEALWAAERFRLRLLYKQEVIFKELSPSQLARMIDVHDMMIDHAPEYLLHTNTKFSKKELKPFVPAWSEFVHFVNNAQGARNYDSVHNSYQLLYQNLDEYMKREHGKTLLMSHQKNIELEYQQDPHLFLRYMYEFGAWIYYRLHFEQLKPKIRVAMSMWFFLERQTKRESDIQDEGVLRELRRYQSLQDSYLRLKKSLDEHRKLLGDEPDVEEISNESTINSIETSA